MDPFLSLLIGNRCSLENLIVLLQGRSKAISGPIAQPFVLLAVRPRLGRLTIGHGIIAFHTHPPHRFPTSSSSAHPSFESQNHHLGHLSQDLSLESIGKVVALISQHCSRSFSSKLPIHPRFQPTVTRRASSDSEEERREFSETDSQNNEQTVSFSLRHVVTLHKRLPTESRFLASPHDS